MNAIASILAHTVGHASLHILLSDRHLSYILFYSKFLNIVPWKQCIWRHSVLYWCIVRHTTFYLDKHCKHLAAALSWTRPKYSTFNIYIRMYFTEPRYMYIFQLHQYLMPLIFVWIIGGVERINNWPLHICNYSSHNLFQFW